MFLILAKYLKSESFKSVKTLKIPNINCENVQFKFFAESFEKDILSLIEILID
jgi:hypothetical protein